MSEPRTEEEIRACTVGEPVRLSGPIALVDYDPRWPSLYAREAKRVRGILGQRVQLLEHAGSTAVVDLPAKPIIDMVLAIPDSSDERAYVPQMEQAGYRLCVREPDWHEHRVLKGPDTNINLHVFSTGCPEVDRMLLFRDWLRAHREDRDLYATTKRELARRDWEFVQHYADAKTAVVRQILQRAHDARQGAADASG